MLCRDASLVKHGDGWGVAVPLLCRSWTCDYCAPIRRSQLLQLAENGTPTKLITLTCNPASGISPADRAQKLARMWRLIVARARRQLHLGSIDYLAVFESTKRGEPHLHILARCGFIPQKWLSAQAKEILNSPIVDIRQIKDPTRAAKYVAKYIGKDLHRFATCKRYWHTKNWVTKETEDHQTAPWGKGDWYIAERPVWQIAINWRTHGLPAVEVGKDLVYYGTPPPEAQESIRKEALRGGRPPHSMGPEP